MENILSFFFFSSDCFFFCFLLFLSRLKNDRGPFFFFFFASLSTVVLKSSVETLLFVSFFLLLSRAPNHLLRIFLFFLGCSSLTFGSSLTSNILRDFCSDCLSAFVFCCCSCTKGLSCLFSFTVGLSGEDDGDCVVDTFEGVGNTEDITGWLLNCVKSGSFVSVFTVEGDDGSFLVVVRVVSAFFSLSSFLREEVAFFVVFFGSFNLVLVSNSMDCFLFIVAAAAVGEDLVG
mmetsp:Transcript_17584/g.27156  ORF Transcript_17584/g.27156 Transcript_17584/m.27156 type:complete len:232 (-) Transcript_17584:127-822(-)